ncbi:MAG TPA: hypothetical protein VF545_00535 [Thermoleophilaceae bacterium]
MGQKPDHNPIEQRREPPERGEPRPQDPATNTRPRGNGTRDSGETDRSTRKLEAVLGH